MLISDLEQLGLTEEESRVYLAVLELGGSYVSAIAKKARAHRVNCYHTLDKLVRKGLISSFTQNKIKHYAVESPKILVNQLEERYQQAKKLLPELLSITNTLAYKPKIQYYEGLQGIKNIFESTIESNEEILGYTNLAELPKVIPEGYLRDYAKRKVAKKVKTRMLSPRSKEALEYIQKYYPGDYDMNSTEILFINPEEYPFEYEINIYGNFVSIVSLNPNEPIGMIMESPLYAKSQRSLFKLAWLGATSFVAK